MQRDVEKLQRQKRLQAQRLKKEATRFNIAADMYQKEADNTDKAALESGIRKQLEKAERKLAKTRIEVDAQVEKSKQAVVKATVSIEKTPNESKQRNEHHQAVVELEKLLVHARALISDVPTN